MYYFEDNDKIVAIAENPANENWQETDKNIVWSYAKCSYVFEEDLPSEQEEQQAMLLEEQTREQEKQEQASQPSQLDIIEAQVMYTALITDSLLEEGEE